MVALKFLVFNVENLLPKMDESDFINLMEKHDICIFTETWLVSDKKLGLSNFRDFHQVRLKLAKRGRNSGGVSIFIKKEIKKGVKFVQKSEGFIWVKLEKKFFNTPEDIFLCAAYIPPQYSVSKATIKVNFFETLKENIRKFQCMGNVILAGDFNSRLGFDPNVENLEIPDLDAVLPPERKNDSIIPRSSCDPIQNQYGKKLSKICHNFCIRVANGRTLGDLMGNYTCHTSRGSSVVDLVLSDHAIGRKIKKLKVLPPQFASVHCPISFTLECSISITASAKLEQRPPKVSWLQENEGRFLRELEKASKNFFL